jgi:hypothetical protein
MLDAGMSLQGSGSGDGDGDGDGDSGDHTPVSLLPPHVGRHFSLLVCQQQSQLATGPLLALAVVCRIRALLLVQTVVGNTADDESHLAALHFLDLLSSSPLGAEATAWALHALDALSALGFLRLLTTSPRAIIDRRPDSSRQDSSQDSSSVQDLDADAAFVHACFLPPPPLASPHLRPVAVTVTTTTTSTSSSSPKATSVHTILSNTIFVTLEHHVRCSITPYPSRYSARSVTL